MENEPRTFGWALFMLWKGYRVQRRGWNGKGMYLELQTPDYMSKMTEPYIFMKDALGRLWPWTPAQLDLLGRDWDYFLAPSRSEGIPLSAEIAPGIPASYAGEGVANHVFGNKPIDPRLERDSEDAPNVEKGFRV